MKYSIIKFIILVFLFQITFNLSNAQSINQYNLSGNLSIDSHFSPNMPAKIKNSELNLTSPNAKSPVLAGVFSGILPGAGEIYAGSYLKAAILITVEAAAIVTAVIYNNKGDSQTQAFENFANQHWSVIRYAEWTLANVQHINSSVNPASFNILVKDNNGNVTGINWSELNRLESALGDGYSHMLPHQGEQQYYELIGKYPQYSHGWDAANQSDTDFHILTPEFNDYTHQRAVANDYYATSKTGLIIVYVNHFLSIFDAIWSVSRFNKSLAVNFRVNNYNLTDQSKMVPTLNLSYNF